MTFSSSGSNDMHSDNLPTKTFARPCFLLEVHLYPGRVALGRFQLHITQDDFEEERE